MPTIYQFLDIFDAISRKDWKEIVNIGSSIADGERAKKHYSAATKIKDAVSALEISLEASNSSVAAQVNVPPPLDLLSKGDEKFFEEKLVFAPKVSNDLSLFYKEWEQKELLKSKDIKLRNTMLFHGPPGCGKTALAHQIANKLRRDIYIVRFDAIISSYLGETGSNLKKVFDFANINRCVIFLDEIDAVAKLRDDRTELGELKRVVITLLQNIDRLAPDSLLIAATNHAHLLDPALWRRFDIVWALNPPNEDARELFFSKYFNAAHSKSLKELTELSEGMSGAEMTRAVNEAKRREVLEGTDIIESIFLAFVDQRRRTEGKEDGNKLESRLIELVKALRKINSKRYTFSALEELTGIPHSTIHHKLNRKNGQ
jgi:SpoVK/Ycf46/Vps4 family AAA+-type ATPase